MEEIFYKKDKNEWCCYDRFGHEGRGKTAQLAKNSYYLQYVIPTDPVVPQVDMSKYLRGITNE